MHWNVRTSGNTHQDEMRSVAHLDGVIGIVLRDCPSLDQSFEELAFYRAYIRLSTYRFIN
jgi:hypothetical protein